MKKWELARYLIDAKKCVDSIMFIKENHSSLTNINLRKKVSGLKNDFYINCAIVMDHALNNKKRKELKIKDQIIKKIYYDRNKNSAHKDEDYKSTEYSSLEDMVTDLKNQIIHVKKICSDELRSVVTLDFVSYDPELFRFIRGMTSEKENLINEEKYPLKKEAEINNKGKSYKVLDDTEDMRDINETDLKDFATIVENGINELEGLQNRQDFCIKTNVLNGTNIWASFDNNISNKLHELRNLGLLNEYNIPKPELLFDPEIQQKLMKIIKGEDRNM